MAGYGNWRYRSIAPEQERERFVEFLTSTSHYRNVGSSGTPGPKSLAADTVSGVFCASVTRHASFSRSLTVFAFRSFASRNFHSFISPSCCSLTSCACLPFSFSGLSLYSNRLFIWPPALRLLSPDVLLLLSPLAPHACRASFPLVLSTFLQPSFHLTLLSLLPSLPLHTFTPPAKIPNPQTTSTN
ncbi:hypothetical protein BDW02DRAFT_114385 [Decorospora gaudefroyi]|uniref:Uncharacterized protein n=1 Tax=Decorospora gaudefroyi TaxID=184978 RepID=A0A6A5K6P8_9PLEO|nr:hypothetical protein BDW02DRAFT_114385 [Decorospora gaudefroyi]